MLAIVTIVSYLLVRERDSVAQAAARSSSNIVQLIESDILRNVELYDQSLRGLVWAVQHPDLLEVPTDLRQQLLFNQSFTARVRGDLLWLDAEGNVIGDSNRVAPARTNFGNTGVFQAHLHNPDLGLLIGPPFKAKLGSPEWCISFTRRIPGPDGTFAGLAAGAMRLSYFSQLFQRLDLGADSSITLINSDGLLLARQPASAPDSITGTDYSKRINFQRIRSERSGSFTAPSASIKSERLYTFARVDGLPLIILVTQSTDEVFRLWRRTALLVSVATGALCLGILWLTLLLGRELRRRQEAERGLEQLASTDSLTGLANRRRLDQVLRQEWARSQRNRTPIAVLMIDVDYFKAFNQRHGHAGGDHALHEVALAINECIRRPADIAARYGGEEFQVVLPETGLAGALLLAERIRSCVEALPRHSGDTVPITVSIGVGVHEPGTQQDLASLLGTADEALYRAKAKGRNRVESLLD